MRTILVPLSRPEQAAILATFILPVAQSEGARVILLHIAFPAFVVEGGEVTQETRIAPWLEEVAGVFDEAGVEVQIVRREAYSVAGGIREAVRAFKPDLLALSWRRPGPGQADVEGVTLHDLLLDVPCDLVVWRGDQAASPPRRVLVPSAGGPNVALGFQFAEDFHRAYGSQLILLTVLPLSATEAQVHEARRALEARGQKVLAELSIPADAVHYQVVRAKTPEAGILQMATPDHADVVIIGASREGVLHRIRFGEIPEKVAAQAKIPVLVIKRPLPRRVTLYRRAWDVMSSVTPNLQEMEKVTVYREARRSARADRDFVTMIALSTIIATLGLKQNAPAVIIGAMLIAPLMAAIIAMGLGVVQGDARLLKLGGRTTALGVLITLAVSFGLELIIPYNNLTHEMLARSSPNLLDLGVALAAGAAGAYALARKDVSSSLPGVAIAVALIPPLATTGMALALAAWRIALGSGLLFLTNLVGIVAMSSWVFLSMGFLPPQSRGQDRMRLFSRGWQGILVMIILISIPLALVTVRQIQHQHLSREIELALDDALQGYPTVTVTGWDYEERNKNLLVTLELDAETPLSREEMTILQGILTSRLHRPVALYIKFAPVIRLEP